MTATIAIFDGVDDRDVLRAGVTAGIDLALWLMEREWGRQLADALHRDRDPTDGRRAVVADFGCVALLSASTGVDSPISAIAPY